MIFKSQQVNLDPQPYVAPRGTRWSSDSGPEGRYSFDPRPDFEPTRDPEPWLVSLTSAKGYNGRWREWRGVAHDWDDALVRAEQANPGWVAHTGGFIPRREQFDTPVNRVLVAFREDAEYELPRFYGDRADRALAWLEGVDGYDGIQCERIYDLLPLPTPAEIDHARRVLTRLANLTDKD